MGKWFGAYLNNNLVADMGLFKEGEFFGYLALLEDKPYAETAEVLEDAEICLVPKEDFFALIYNNISQPKKGAGLDYHHLKENHVNIQVPFVPDIPFPQ